MTTQSKARARDKNLRRKLFRRLIREHTIASWSRFSDLSKQLYSSGILVVVALMLLLAFIGAWFGLAFEQYHSGSRIHSMLDALWWAIVTMTTTGYGDIVPLTFLGRGAGVLLMFGGIALVSIFSATISSVFIMLRLNEGRGLRKVLWTDHLLVCGWNGIAVSLLDALQCAAGDKPRIVLVNQLNPEEIQTYTDHYPDLKLQFVHGDDTQEEILKRANIAEASTIIILSREKAGDDRQIMVVLAARALNKDAMIYAQVSDQKNIYHLKHAGVDDVVYVAPYAGFLLANHAMNPGIPQVYEELMNPQDRFSFVRVPIAASWHERSYGEFSTDYRRETGGQIIGLIQESSLLSAGDILSHDSASIDEFIRRKFIEAGLSQTELEREQVRLNPPDSTLLQPRDVAVALPGRGAREAKK